MELDFVQEVGVASDEETEKDVAERKAEAGDSKDKEVEEQEDREKKQRKRKTNEKGEGEKAKKVKESFKDKFLAIQERQMETFIESDRQNREFLVKLEEQQQEAARKEREWDHEFVMQLATLLTKK